MVVVAALWACGGEDEDGSPPGLWTSQSERLEYSAAGAFGGTICEATFERSELSSEQLEQLEQLEFVEGTPNPACDPQTYNITVHYEDGTTRSGLAAPPFCATQQWVIPYEDFDAVARSLGCPPG